MHNDFKSIGEAFKNHPAFKGLRELVKSNDVAEDFEKIFPDLKKIARAVKVDKKVLKLKVDNPAWRSELKFRETEIVEKINNYYNENRVNHIRFTS
jgi:hypothetical protein